ncbi:perlucin-like [Diabrotica virgifera virgifera]|uniref:Perlucin-like n=1 Tax=Diabrotica virgifera virgifera TaxID=50390 RepID=A0A6P7FZ55_DIAVI|nr:perlucin-like [Diabrotica virgifera virgifera]
MALFNSVILLSVLTLIGSTLVTSCKDYPTLPPIRPVPCRVDKWEDVFRDRQSPVIPLKHWGNKSYWIGTTFQATWFEAIDFCHQMHMQLLTINSAEENEVIYGYIKQANKGFEYWTAGTRLVDDIKYVWFPYGDLVRYTNWSKGQPDFLTGEQCLQLWKADEQLQWNDRPCDVRFYFICERYDCQNTGRGPPRL